MTTNTLKIAANCKHRDVQHDNQQFYQTGWCYDCLMDLILDLRQLYSIGQSHQPKHGFGPPQQQYERGVYFVKYKDTDHEKHKVGYWCNYAVTNDSWVWSQDIEEYFGPIPLKVWNVKEPEAPKTLPELYNIAVKQLHEDFDRGAKIPLLSAKTLDLLRAMSERLDELKQTVDQLQAKQEPIPITKGAGMQ